LLCDADAHVVTYEIGAAAAIGGVSSRTWPAVGGDIDPAVVAAMVRPDGYYAVPTRAIAVEQTHNRGGGAVIPLATLTALRGIADEGGLALHCDGARIWHAHVADRVPLTTYGALFDTMSVCLSKGLGAPVGSVMVSTAERIERARWIRKRMGGGMRQAGILAAAGRYALAHHVTRLAEDHTRARRIATAFADRGYVDPSRVRTNIVVLNLDGDARRYAAAAREIGVLVSVIAPRAVRLITHLDLSDYDVDKAIEGLLALTTPDAP
jgi:threonine aldolase